MAKKIELTQGKFAIVDDGDFERLNQHKWSAQKGRNTYYAIRGVRENGKHKRIYMHIEILGKKNGLQIDHINGNGIDNRRTNLRHVTSRQNRQNLHINKSSKYPGVYFDNYRLKWVSGIRVNGKHKNLGRFNNEIDAFNRYRIAVMELGDKVVI